MKVTIKQVIKDLPAVEALLMQPHLVKFDDHYCFPIDESEAIEDYPDEIDIEFVCDSISVDDVRISIMFPNGYIGDYEIQSDCYHSITII